MKKLKLNIELVPSSSWYNNVRVIVTKTQWDKIKSIVASKAYYICEICGGAGPAHPVECHEVWAYNDETYVQTLERMIALCPDCHMVKHFGLAKIMNRTTKATTHLMKVNKIDYFQANQYIEEAFKLWAKRSNKNWTVDISHLKNYGI